MALNRFNNQSSNNVDENSGDSYTKFFNFSQNRFILAIGFFVVLFLIIIGRLFYLQVVVAEENSKAAEMSRTIQFSTTPKRGTIYDRNGNVLAYSKEAKTVYANPSEIENVKDTAQTLVKYLGGSSDDYVDLIDDSDKKFVYIKRRIEKDVGEQLDKENVKGIYVQDDQKREYPYKQIGGQIIGACNVDGNGLCGLELYYDDVLRGSTGTTVRQQGMFGMPIPGGTLQETQTVDGQDIMISVDIELQQKVEEILVANNQTLGSKSMHSIITDPQTGEIYAAASLPLLNPADINSAQEGSTDLKCISSTFEPGSTFKTVSAMSILEHGALTPDSTIFCPNIIHADEYDVSDAHDRADQTFSLREIISRSSNVGISLASERLGFDKLYNKIKKYRLNEMPGVDFPGDTSGYLLDFDNWSKIQSYNVSFGQGVTVTPLQTTTFYGGIANNGVEVTPHFLMRYLQSARDETYESYDIIENKAAIPIMTSMLRSVVTDGTGKMAEIPGYGVVGKTGTGEIADSNGKYLEGTYYISFVGFLSQSNMPITCFVGAENVSSESSTTQVYNEIMKFAIDRLKLVPRG